MRALAERGGGGGAQRSQRVQPAKPSSPGARAHVGVQGFFVGAQFAHVAQHQPAFPAVLRTRGGERLDGRDQRAGVGVVAVVDHHRAVRQHVRDLAPGDRLRGRQTVGDGRQRYAACHGERRGGERIAYVVATRQVQADRDVAMRRHQHEIRSVHGRVDVACLQVGRGIQPETQDAAIRHAAGEVLGERVVGIDHRGAVGRQRVVDGALGFGHADQRTHALQVGGGDVIHQRHFRRDDVGEVGDVARLAGAHLVDGEVRIVGRVDDRQRQADLVVAVAGVEIGDAGPLQDGDHQRLDRGLAVAAGDGDRLFHAVALQAGGDARQRQQGIRHDDLRHVDLYLVVDQHRGGTAHGGVVGEVVPVEALATQRHVKAARHQGARVVGQRADHQIIADQLATGPVRQQGKGKPLHRRSSRAWRATAVSSNGCFTPWISW